MRQETFARAEHAVAFAQTNPAIRFAMSALGDHHSFLGKGTAGWFVDLDGSKSAWTHVNGQAMDGGSTALKLDAAYHLKHPNPPVAVLTDPLTSCANEAIVAAFRVLPTAQFWRLDCRCAHGQSGFSIT